jgi:putative chitinase
MPESILPLTPDTLAAAARIPPERARAWVEPLNDILPHFQITTARRVAAFLAQCGHESAGFTQLAEDLDYSAHRLMQVWPSRFKTAEFAALYAHNPVKLGNFVYASRNGNGHEDSGDGYTFRARGLIGLTGRGNYAATSQRLFGGPRLVQFPDHVAESQYVAAATAADYWRQHRLNDLADMGAYLQIGNTINTGSAARQAIGTADRIARTETALEALA